MARVFGKCDGKKQRWIRDAIEIVLIFVVVVLIFHFAIGVSFVKGTSMLPTLHNNEMVLFFRVVPGGYDRGDIVSIRMPSGEYYVKRVVAVAGDTVDIRGGSIFVSGREIKEEYTYGSTEPQGEEVEYPLVVEGGKLFVMGDNREYSKDSRSFGTVVDSQIEGKLVLHMGRL